MMDLHDNVYYYYRGPVTDPRIHDTQLENNTTKALINTLKQASGRLVQEFLSWLHCPGDGKVTLSLQRVPIPHDVLTKKRHTLLLAIVGKPSRWRPDSSRLTAVTARRPDAWIVGRDFVVVIESKMGKIDEQQMQSLYDSLGADGCRYREVTWTDIHEFFRGVLSKTDGLDAWLVGQFVQYLEYMNMCEFSGFKKEFFDSFSTLDDQDSRRWVKDTMYKFALKLLPELSKIDPPYEVYHVGRLELLPPHYCWAAFGRNKRWKEFAHQTVSADSQGLEIFVNVELKPAADRLKNKIRKSQSTWRKILADLRERTAFYIRIEECRLIAPRKLEYLRICNVWSRYLDDVGLGYVESILRTINHPYLSARTTIGRKQVIELSESSGGSKLVENVAGIMAEFHPLVKFINHA